MVRPRSEDLGGGRRVLVGKTFTASPPRYSREAVKFPYYGARAGVHTGKNVLVSTALYGLPPGLLLALSY